MPIGAEQWRVSIGRFYAFRVPLRSPTCNQQKADSATLAIDIFMALGLLPFRLGIFGVLWFHLVLSVFASSASRLLSSISKSLYRNLRDVLQIPLSLYLILWIFWINPGDVETYHGPPKKEGQPFWLVIVTFVAVAVITGSAIIQWKKRKSSAQRCCSNITVAVDQASSLVYPLYHCQEDAITYTDDVCLKTAQPGRSDKPTGISSIPFMNIIELFTCNSSGGVYYNPVHDVSLTIPVGAIPEGILITIEIGITFCGMFQFPVDVNPVSPIVWLCVQHLQSFQFQKPVEVTLPHCLSIVSSEECESLQPRFFTANHCTNGYYFKPAQGRTTVNLQKGYATLITKHFCLYCLAVYSPDVTEKARYCLITVQPKTIDSPSWTIHFCVAYFLETCIQAVKEQYGSGYEITVRKFTFSSTGQDAALCIDFQRDFPGRLVLQSPKTISKKEICFWERSLDELALMHKTSIYPPRFSVAVRRGKSSTFAKIQFKGAKEDLYTEIALFAEKTSHEELLEQALRRGYILTDLTKVTVSGPPGVGKSHLWYYLLNQVPPTIRCSTACIEQARRIVISSSSSDTEGSNWEEVGPERMVKMVAETISAGVTLSEDKTENRLNPVQHVTNPAREERSTVEGVPTSQHHLGDAQLDHSPAPLILKETAKIAELLPTFTEARQVLRAHFLIFLDTGGQPSFLDIFAAFIHKISLQLLVFKLSERLKELPVVDYYSPDGLSYQLGHFVSTNEELLMQSAQVAQSQRHQISLPCIEKQPECPKVLVVGTFKDLESRSQETREEKNIQLSQSLQSLGEQLIRRSSKEVIFPVNTVSTKSPGNRDPVSFELRNAIATSEQSLRIKYPLGYYLLESELRRFGAVVSRDQCWAVAQQLLFESEEAMDAALQFLHEVNLFFYYPEVIKNTIFVNPMVVIEKVSQLFEKITELKDAAEVDIQSREMLLYRNQAIFSSDFIKKFTSGYHDDLFTVNNLINILEHLLMIAALPQEDSTNFFMPSLLELLEDEEIVRPSSGAVAPLFIHFENENAPNGVFCALIVHLLSSGDVFHWKLLNSELDTFLQLNKSQLTLQLFFGEHSAEIEFINTKIYYEVHVNSISFPELLPLVWEDIDLGLQCVYQRFSYVATHKMAFQCQCQQIKSHTAILSKDYQSWQCTKDLSISGSLSDKQKLWLPLTCFISKDPECKYLKYDPTFPGVCFLDEPWQASVTSDGEIILWDEIGVRFDVPPGAIPEHDTLQLTVRPCLSGPFSLPEEYELTSSVYFISPLFDFNKDVQLSLKHYANLECREDCNSMVFISARSSQAQVGSEMAYKFKVLGTGVFHEEEHFGSISLRHFCGLATARRKRRHTDENLSDKDNTKRTKENEDSLYSVQLYQSPAVAEKLIAIFCISLCNPVHIQSLRKCLEESFPDVPFGLPAVIEPVLFSEQAVSLVLPPETGGWRIISNRIPCKILKSEVDLPKSSPNCVTCNYPPKIRLSIFPVHHSQKIETNYTLRVVGFENDVAFTLDLCTPFLQHNSDRDLLSRVHHPTIHWEHQILSQNSADIITVLAANKLSNILATQMKARKLIGTAVHAQATNYGPNITEYTRVQHLITALEMKVKINSQRYYDFIKVLQLDGICEDAEAALVLLPTGSELFVNQLNHAASWKTDIVLRVDLHGTSSPVTLLHKKMAHD